MTTQSQQHFQVADAHTTRKTEAGHWKSVALDLVAVIDRLLGKLGPASKTANSTRHSVRNS